MNILVVGSEGFIGSHCCSYFGNDNIVVSCDIRPQSSKPNYIPLKTFSEYAPLFKEKQFDLCINCAGAANVSDSFVNPQHDFTLNVQLVSVLLEAIRVHNPMCSFINLSSAAVYGNPISIPITESFPLNPISPYGAHKKIAEDLCSDYYNFFNIKTVSLRIFSAYGEGLMKQIFWDTFNKMKNSDHVVLWGTGHESRDFIYIRDIMSVIEQVSKNNYFNGNSINVASGQEVSIHDAVYSLAGHLNWKGTIDFNSIERKGDPIRWKADISTAKQMGFKPQFTIETGLKKTAKWLLEL